MARVKTKSRITSCELFISGEEAQVVLDALVARVSYPNLLPSVRQTTLRVIEALDNAGVKSNG